MLLAFVRGMSFLVNGLAQVGANVLGNVVDRVLPEKFKASAIGQTFSSVLKGVNSAASGPSPLAVGLEKAGIKDFEGVSLYKQRLQSMLINNPEVAQKIGSQGAVVLNLTDGDELSLLCSDGSTLKLEKGSELYRVGMTFHQMQIMGQLKETLPSISVKDAANQVMKNPQYAANWNVRTT